MPRLLIILPLALLGTAAVVGPYWWYKIRPRIQAMENPYSGHKPSDPQRLKVHGDNVADFDRLIDLPVDPIGVTSNGAELLVVNRAAGGFLRMRADGPENFVAQQIPVIETTYRQRMSFSTVTWNGKNYVGYTSGDWYRVKSKNIFTVHDPRTLQVVDWRPAPPLLGGLAWDGKTYWASTRKNTEDSEEPAFLYQLDADFQVLAKYPPPGVGCQGLAWDGKYLWFVDVFTDTIHVLDVKRSTAEIVHSYPSRFSYLSGIGFDGRNIWISEYDKNRLHRLNPRLRMAWTKQTQGIEVTMASVIHTTPASLVEGESIEELERQVRSDQWAARMRAEMRMRELGLPIRYDRDQNNFVKKVPDDTEVVDWSAEIRNGTIIASWNLYYGAELFNRDEGDSSSVISIPKFARYEIRIEGDGLKSPIRHEFEAEPGDNIRRNVELASGLPSGKYSISLFLHVQYRRRDGVDQILNRSGMTLQIEE